MEIFASEAARLMFAAWFLLLGGAVGSFLNVVVYRLPAGMSILWPSSHCPRCKHSIRSYDNIPVLAWLWLRGRCRDCGAPISPRYPLVEALTAGLFLLMLVVEVFHGGDNLPLRIPPPAGQLAVYPPVMALPICLLHLGLLCTLMAAGLMAWDGRRPPRRLFAPLLLVGFVAPMIWPWLHPQPAEPSMAHNNWSGVIDSLAGLAAGYYAGRLAQWLGRRLAGLGRPGYQVLAQSMLLGVVLGWQSAILLLLASMVLEEVSRIAFVRWAAIGRRLSAGIWLMPLTLAWILNWARLAAAFRAG